VRRPRAASGARARARYTSPVHPSSFFPSSWARRALVIGAGGLLTLLCAAPGAGCEANVGGVASEIANAHGSRHDAYCDRRFVERGRPAAFCQEVLDTVAAQRFIEDCEQKHGARTEIGRCPRERILGGCRVGSKNDDGSVVYDWYYDVRDIEADAGDVFLAPPRTSEAVRALCANPSQYDQGAVYVGP